jgi:hypothetical protein
MLIFPLKIPYKLLLVLNNFLPFLLIVVSSNLSFGQKILEPDMHHLRTGKIPEWSEFNSSIPKGPSLTIKFNSEINHNENTLFLRQRDVKQVWQISLNKNKIGTLIQDENDLIATFSLLPKTLITGENTLVIEQMNSITDDIIVGEVVLDPRSKKEVLHDATVSIEIYEVPSGTSIPAKLTIVNSDGVLQPVGAQSINQLAVRPGYVYTGNGQATFGLPAGSYIIYASRGFEYGIDSVNLQIKAGDRIQQKLEISREVKTEGWVSSDTPYSYFYPLRPWRCKY